MNALRRGDSLGVVGAGVSTWAGYGSWSQVIKDLANAVQALRPQLDTHAIIKNNRNPLHCAQHLGQYLGNAFGEFIRTEFGPNGQKLDNVLLLLCSIPFRHFLTLNFDYSLEQIHTILSRPYQTVSTRNLFDLVKFMRCHDAVDTPRYLLHLHGTFTDPPGYIALTNDGYGRLYPDGTLFRRFLWWLVTSKSLVFLGFGFTDSDLLGAIRQAVWDLKGQNGPLHFAIRGIGENDNDEAIRNECNDSYKIDPVFYELDETAQNRHVGFVREIERIAAALALPAVVPAVVPTAGPTLEPRPDDLRRAELLGQNFIEKLDPGGDDVPR